MHTLIFYSIIARAVLFLFTIAYASVDAQVGLHSHRLLVVDEQLLLLIFLCTNALTVANLLMHACTC